MRRNVLILIGMQGEVVSTQNQSELSSETRNTKDLEFTKEWYESVVKEKYTEKDFNQIKAQCKSISELKELIQSEEWRELKVLLLATKRLKDFLFPKHPQAPTDQQVVNIVTSGLPPLKFKKIKPSSTHSKARFQKTKFKYEAPKLVSDVQSSIWGEYNPKKGAFLDYDNEADIRGYVTLVYKEILISAGLHWVIKTREERSLLAFRPDHTALNRGKNRPIGVGEVKPPLPNSQDPQQSSFGQLYNYLQTLKHRQGVKKPYGILSTYEYFYICWLPESDTGEQRIVYGEAFKWDDKRLPYALAAVFTIMLKSEVIRVGVGIDRKRLYMSAKVKSVEWTSVNWKCDKINYNKMPSANNTTFYMLKDLGGGKDGRVHLACDDRGQVCVIKFFKTPEKAKVEKKIWDEINKTKLSQDQYVRLMKLVECRCLIMPFVANLPTKDRRSTNPKVMKALVEMANLGYTHKDLKWEHVGLIDEQIVFLDFSDMGKTSKSPDIEAKRMLNKLYKDEGEVDESDASENNSSFDESNTTETTEMDATMDSSTFCSNDSVELAA
eukprot:TRINITY_DN3137_c0_g1_i1.p1 TRINITY_DN3137_c0_g1~~TRINITY_DN3137_c0_g1_i1.p1  ORF type:complete len:560 (+),score=54.73 TRINITY_DN3137_c0_g1_i1:25-1680(+)